MAKDLKIDAHGLTDIGKVRTTNQDSIALSDQDKLYIVADGMGGHAGGEIASLLAINNIPEYLRQHAEVFKDDPKRQHPDPKIKSTLADAVNFASTKIYERALEEPIYRGMGTTVTMVKFIDDVAYIAHVGDSRLYLYRKDFIYQLTLDHSLVSEQVRAGLISEAEAEAHHLRNVITRSVGYQEEEYVDTYFCKLENKDKILICSDGLHGRLSDIDISQIIKNKANDKAPMTFVDQANLRGGDDNISVITISIQVS